MAWTAPRTWVPNEVVTAAMMNTHVRDNLLETGPAKVSAAAQGLYSTGANAITAAAAAKVKTSDDTWNNTTTLTNVGDMAFTVAADEIWLVRYHLRLTSSSGIVFSMNIGWSYPATPPGQGPQYWVLDPAFGGNRTRGPRTGPFSASGSTSFDVDGGDTLGRFGIVIAVFYWADDPGTVQMMAAQPVATAQDDKIIAGSSMTLTRVA